jgi:hypothetical protein
MRCSAIIECFDMGIWEMGRGLICDRLGNFYGVFWGGREKVLKVFEMGFEGGERLGRVFRAIWEEVGGGVWRNFSGVKVF